MGLREKDVPAGSQGTSGVTVDLFITTISKETAQPWLVSPYSQS